MVPGGGGGGSCSSNSNSNGSAGGGMLCMFSKDIDLTGITINLNANITTANNETSGGTGSGGSCLIKCVNATLGTNKITATSPQPPSTTWSGGRGATGSVGRINVDYSGSITGTTNPTLSSRLDSTIKAGGGAQPTYYTEFI